MVTNSNSKNFDQYLAAGLWKCEKSPTGAHHWVVGDKREVCKFCNKNRILMKEAGYTSNTFWRKK